LYFLDQDRKEDERARLSEWSLKKVEIRETREPWKPREPR
jgi:hypothetical protein